jgi:transcriptional regulator with XRE-family HTH domain
MPNTLNLIEQVRRRVPKHTDYAVAKALEMSQSNLTRVLCGKSGLGVKAAVRLSELLQRDLRDVLCLVEEDKAKTPREREFWERRSPRISAAILTTILGIVAGLGMIANQTANAASTVGNYSARLTDLYIMRTMVRWFRLTFRRISESFQIDNTVGSSVCDS